MKVSFPDVSLQCCTSDLLARNETNMTIIE